MKRCFYSLVFALFLTGCTSFPTIQNPDYVVQDVRTQFVPSLPPRLELDFLISVDNPNPVGLRLDRMDFDVFLNNSHILRGVSNQNLTIPAQGTGNVQISTRVSYDQLRDMWDEVREIIRTGQPRYELRGTASYGTPLGNLNIPFTILKRQ